ncbi:MAG: TaqI-like C-terminal specificity domain-containing protein [Melioribacteraceae bacterium]
MEVKEILKSLTEKFNFEDLSKLFRNKTKTFREIDQSLSYLNDENFSDCKLFGEFRLENSDEMVIITSKVNKPLSERSGKKAQYTLGKNFLKQANRYCGGFFIFYDDKGDFRFSLIYDIPLATGKRDWSNFRRYTYFVSKDQTNKTFIKQIEEADFSSLEKIIDAFSIEKVTKEFYQEIANWYFWAIKKLKFPDDAEKDENGRNIATIRLITRLIFIWFMKVRKLIPDELFDENSLKNILKSFKLNDTNYYKAILQNLFFATLNTKQNERRFTSKKKGYKGFSTDFGNHNVYRYEELFKNSEEAIEKYFMPIPFLNGGLFECLDYKSKIKDERMYIDGFTSTKSKQPVIPNELFFAEEKQVDLNKDYGTSNKKYNVRGLIKILSQYNFTIDENDPNDAEVALDPELLGKVFENLLASYNPETANTARKSTGSYYTPRPIVDYMVDESLKQYFRTFLEQGTDNIPVVGDTATPVSRDAHGTFFNPYDEVDIHINNLPHWQQKDVWYFVTFRLNDSIPRETLEQIKREREQWLTKHKKNSNQPYSKEELKEYYRLFSERIENLLDECKGSCVLKEERIAKIVADALLYFNNKKYILDDWVIMPNHVHILVKPINGYTLPEITHSWKSFTANEINKILGKKGQFWLHESYDHIVRNETAFNAIKNYIRNNPVKANLNLPACAQSWMQGTDNIPVVGNTPVSRDAHGTFESKDALDTLFEENTDNPFDAATTEKLVALIDSLRAVDPAVGSGAFPMRLLNRLVFLLHKLDPNNELWKKSQIEGIKKSVKDPVLQRKFIEQIEKKFNEKNPDYGRKLYLIEKCIYGVDIQQIAVEIAKLRFFISLLVDEKIDFEKPEENYGIEPLPNLDFKLMQGNSLISSFAGIDFNRKQDDGNKLFSFDDNYKKLIEEFEELKSQYQNEPEVDAKRKLKEDIDKKLLEIFEEKLNQHFPQLQTINEKAAYIPNKEKRKEYIEKEKKNLFKKIGIDLEQAEKDLIAYTEGRKQKNFFLWDIYFAEVFTEKGGFDIVIGNPPYIQLQKNHGVLSKLYKDKGYKTFDSMGDIYCLFYEKGINLLKEKGHLCYITSNKWMRAGYGEVLREYFTKYNPKILIDLGPGIFESATVDTNILLIQKSNSKTNRLSEPDLSGEESQFNLLALTLTKENNIDFNKQLNEKGVTLTKLTKEAWFIGSSAEQKLKEKIERIGKPLKDWDVNIYRGVLTGLNEAFIISTEKRNEILANCKDEDERRRTEAIIKPILRGRDIKRYYYEWAGLWVIVIPAGWTNENRGKENAEIFIEKTFPSLMDYLRPFEEKAKKRDDQGDYWWELRQCAYYPEFEKEKVVWQRITQEPTFCLVESDIFILDSMAFFTGNNLKYIMAILNSKLIYEYVSMIVHQYGFTGFRLSNQYVEIMPLPPITSANQPIVQQIESLADKILAAKKENPQADTSQWEREIDQLVYKLYDLTEEEIKIIKGGK